MGEWKEVTIDELFTVQNGYAFKSSDYVEENEKCFEVFKMGHIERGGGLRKDPKKSYIPRSEYLERWVLDKDDIVMAMTDMKDNVVILGVPAIIDKDNYYVLNQRVARLKLNRKDIADIYFLYNYLKWKEFLFELQSKANSGVQVNLSTTTIKDSIIYLPPLPEQKAIASVLSSLDDKIDLLHRQNKTLESLAETIFRQWFVEEAKEDWETGALGDFVNIAYGKTLPTKNLQKNGYPVFGGNGQIGFFEKYLYEKPQVLVSCRGEASGVVNISLPQSFVTNNSLILEMNKRKEMTFEFLKYSALATDFKMYVSGSAQPQITINDLYGADFMLPDKEILVRFSEVVGVWESKRTNNQIQIKTLEKLRDTLLPKLMNGEVRVEYNN